jgi:hypothetical protein
MSITRKTRKTRKHMRGGLLINSKTKSKKNTENWQKKIAIEQYMNYIKSNSKTLRRRHK